MSTDSSTREIDPADVYSGNIVVGEIHVRAFRDDMPEAGEQISFAGYTWLVTRRNVQAPGGRNVFVAILLP